MTQDDLGISLDTTGEIMPRTKRSFPQIENLEAANLAMEELGLLIRRVEAEEAALAQKVAGLRKETDKAIEPLGRAVKQHIKNIQRFATSHRTELLSGGRKTIVLTAGAFGWRSTPWKVTLARGGEKKVIELLKKSGLERYVRTKESLNKETLLQFKPVIQGLKYTQQEKFFVEPKTITESTRISEETQAER